MKLKYPEITKEAIEELYINQNLRIPEIAAIFGCNPCTISRRISKFGIIKPFELIQKNIEETNMQRYGGKTAMSSEEVKEKIKATNLERYGAENVGGLSQFQEKARQTRKERYGDKWESEEATQKRKETNLKIYGAENPIMTEEIKEKIKQTNIEKYGVENPFMLQEVQERIRETNIEKYGTDTLMNVPEIRDKARQTNLKRYGVEWSTLTEGMKEKTRKTNLERYGNVCSVHGGGEGERKTKETIRRKYYEKWGVWRDNVAMAQLILPPRALDVLLTKESFVKYIQSSGKNKIQEIAEDIGASAPTVYRYVVKYDIEGYIDLYTSIIENEIKTFIEEGLGVTVEKTREKIGGLEIDLYSDKYKIGVEVNGEYWHSTTFKKSNYHKAKSLRGWKEGIRILHIFEYEWRNEQKQPLIKGLLRRAFRIENISLDVLEVLQIHQKEAENFILNTFYEYELKFGDEYWGVKCDGELVCVGVFKKRDRTATYGQSWSLLNFYYNPEKYCVNEENKIFEAFSHVHSGEGKITAYSEADKEDRGLYVSLGFEIVGSTKLGFVWSQNGKIKGREDISDEEGKIKGYNKIYDCGNTVWERTI